MPLPQCVVKGLDAVFVHAKCAPVVIVVPHHNELARLGVVLEDRVAAAQQWSHERIVIARRVRRDSRRGQDFVRLGMHVAQDLGSQEAIDEERLASRRRDTRGRLCVAQQMEQLKSGWVGEIRRVRVRAEGNVRVRRVTVREV